MSLRRGSLSADLLLIKYFQVVRSIKIRRLGNEACGGGEKKVHARFRLGNLRVRNHSEHLGVGG